MLDFPNSPALNQIFTSGNLLWTWDGTKWLPASSGATAYVAKSGDTMTGNLIVNPGSVGIGTAAPSTKLAVGSTNFGTDGIAGRTLLSVAETAAANYTGLTVQNVLHSTLFMRAYGTSHPLTAVGCIGTIGEPIIFTPGSNNPTSAANIAMTLMPSGNVGIGKTQPVDKLTVQSATQYTGFTVRNATNNIFAVQGQAAGNDNGSVLILNAGVTQVYLPAAGDKFINGGNVGIGTTGPGKKLHVVNAANTAGYAEYAGFDITNNAGGTNYTRLVLGQNSTNNIFLDAGDQGGTKGSLLLQPFGGNVGIGNANPAAAKLLVSSPLDWALGVLHTVATAGTRVAYIGGGPQTSDTSTNLLMFLDSNAMVTMGSINRAGTNSVTYGTASDIRLKKDITESDRGLDALLTIKVSDYKMGDDRLQQGLLAQEVHQVYPEAVYEGGDDPITEPWMIDYGRLMPLTIKAIQDQQKIINTLLQQVARLEKR